MCHNRDKLNFQSASHQIKDKKLVNAFAGPPFNQMYDLRKVTIMTVCSGVFILLFANVITAHSEGIL